MSPGDHPQNYAIAEQVRTDLPTITAIMNLRMSQILDCKDEGMKRKLQAYFETLKYSTQQISEILDYVKE